jgi:Lsr2
MAQRTTVMVICDLPHEEGEVEVGERPSFRFGFEGAEYEIDPCDDHLAEMTGTLNALAEHARRVGTRPRHAPAGAGRPSARVRDRHASTHMRAWFRTDEGRKRLAEAGVPPPAERGRVSSQAAAVYGQYRDEHRAGLPIA